MTDARTKLLAAFGHREAMKLILEEAGLVESDDQKALSKKDGTKSPTELLREGYAQQANNHEQGE